MEKRAGQTLCGVIYHYASGTIIGTDIDIQLTPEQIVFASFFPWDSEENTVGNADYITLENEPFDPSH